MLINIVVCIVARLLVKMRNDFFPHSLISTIYVKHKLSYILLASFFLQSSLLRSEGLNDLVINEIQVVNIDQFVDPSWNYGAWVEIYNPTNLPYQLRGCWISDDPMNLKKVHITQSTIISGRGYKNLWFGHHDKYCPSQIALKLNQEGGTLYLSNSKGVLLTMQDYPEAVPRSSWARKMDGVDEWGYTNSPTPESTNGNLLFCTDRLPAPEVKEPSCIFENSFSAHVIIPSGATLRYTTDGSTPSMKNGNSSLNGLFPVSSTTIYRFALFQDGYMSSSVVTRTYIKKDKDFSLPVLSIVSSPENLYSESMGIFTKGKNGRPGLGESTPCNWNMDWDRPANFEYFDEDGISVINQETDIFRSGGWSRAWTPYGFKIRAKKIYEGNNSIDYTFFKNKPYNKTKSLLIRNGGNGDTYCRVKDAFLQKLILTSGLDVDAQDYHPVAHFINGVYKGVINLREPNNKDFIYSNYGLDEDEIDQFEIDSDSGYIQKCGTREIFDRWYNMSKNAGDTDVYNKIKEIVDIDEYCNYMAVEFYLGNWDWPKNNCKAWRPIAKNGRFRYIIYDLDGSFTYDSPFTEFENKRIYTFSTLYGEDINAWTKEIEPVTIFINMLQNKEFCRHFIDAFCIVGGSVFEPSRCETLIKEWAEAVYPMQILDDNGYGKNSSPWGTAYDIISNLRNRVPKLCASLKSYLPLILKEKEGLNVKIGSNLPQSQIKINRQIIPTGKFDGILFPPDTIKAIAPRGFVFDGWINNNIQANNPDDVIIKKGDSWTYYDQGSLDGNNWSSIGYGTSKWKTGKAPLGYGNSSSGYNTMLNYGANSNNKYITYYFRKLVVLKEAPNDSTELCLNFKADDGFVLYINETEATRYNMPEGEITYNSLSPTSVEVEPIDGQLTLNSKLLKKGINMIAVEVHNNSVTSSDIYWDASLFYRSSDNSTNEYFCKDEEMVLGNSDLNLTAHFSRKKFESEISHISPIVINEVSAGNSIYVNEYYKKEDWIELYNCTENDINLEGMYISDDINNTKKYCISSNNHVVNTIIPAYGYKIIWCDKQEPLNQLHTPFKLSNQDFSSVILTASDESWADTLVYCAHDGTESIGRYPDGSSILYKMPHPSIANSNMLNMYTTRMVLDDIGEDVSTLHDGNVCLRYSEGRIMVKTGDRKPVNISIYTLNGILVMNQNSEVHDGQSNNLSVRMLRNGIYIATVTDSKNNKYSIKFTK